MANRAQLVIVVALQGSDTLDGQDAHAKQTLLAGTMAENYHKF